MTTGAARATRIAELRRRRPRDRFLRLSAALLAALVAGAWLSGEIRLDELLSERRLANLRRFVTREAVPHPLREEGFSWSGLAAWAGRLWREQGREGVLATLWISIAAIVLSGLFALAVAPLAARTLARREPYLVRAGAPGRAWRALTGAARLACVALRAIPEYVWAFLLVAMIGGSAWPAVLALAIHNGGILGRLYGDTVENVPPDALRSLRMLGTPRRTLYLFGVVPLALPRFLLYFFYRFESCVREATVVGMLGVVSLGSFIAEARIRHFYDEMLLLVGLGVGIVLAGDLASHVARGWVRRAR